jgi:small GTP-binding protein
MSLASLYKYQTHQVGPDEMWPTLWAKTYVSVGIIGDSTVGKSSIVRRYKEDTFTDAQNRGEEWSTKANVQVVRNVRRRYGFVFRIADAAGQRDLPWFRDFVIAFNQAFVIPFSLTDRKSFDFALELVDCLQTQHYPFVIAANKADLVEQRVVSEDEVRAFAARYRTTAFETSAKTEALSVRESRYATKCSTGTRSWSTSCRSIAVHGVFLSRIMNLVRSPQEILFKRRN